MKIIFGLFILIAGFSTVFAQDKAEMSKHFQTDKQKVEMKKLDDLIGKWSGDGWIQQGANRFEFTGTENVQRKLDGLALLVEGRFTDKKDSSKVIHETLAVLNYNAKTGIYDFKTYLATGGGGNSVFKFVSTATYEWGIDYPGNKILYTITIKDGIWNEIGKISRDEGKTWIQFFEMNLKKNQ